MNKIEKTNKFIELFKKKLIEELYYKTEIKIGG